MNAENVAIIGAGPAGVAAAIQLKRYGIEPILFEKEEVGGLLKNANLVENYPGFPRGISGKSLVELFKSQVKSYKIRVVYEQVERLSYNYGEFDIDTSKRKFASKTVIIASGTKPRRIESMDKGLKGKHVFYDIYSISKVKGKRIAIIGAGDIAFDYALTL